MSTQIAYLFGEFDKALKMAQDFAAMVQTNERLSQQVTQLLTERQETVAALQIAGQHELSDKLAQLTPTLAAACVVETRVGPGQDGFEPTPVLLARQIITPGGRATLGLIMANGKVAMGIPAGKQCVETPCPSANIEGRRASASPYGGS